MSLIRLIATWLLAAGFLISWPVQFGALRAQEATPVAKSTETAPALLGGDLPGDPQIQLVEVASGLQAPVNVAFPPDDSGRIFVVEQLGTITIINADGSVEPEPFLDLSSTTGSRQGEQGLLGLAFHPEYAENGRFFVHYNDNNLNGAITVSEFTANKRNPNKADMKTERPLLVIEKSYPQHNGGTLRFGADRYLYISTGDGSWQGDVFDNAQSRFSLLGKILRIDVDGGSVDRAYGIPADNPFAGIGRYDSPFPGRAPEGAESGADEQRITAKERKYPSPVRQEIWAYGFRNPWQFSFDPETGDFYVGDVGAGNWEEIDFQPAGVVAGQNYGWDWLEGSHCYPAEITECPRQQVGVLPVAEYAHGDDGCSVIGIGVYRGEEYPTLDGIYFSGDLCTGKIRGLQRDETGVWQFQDLLDTATRITGAGQDEAGTLYVTTLEGGRGGDLESRDGSLWRLVSADKVPDGATTVPLGTPNRGGTDEVSDEQATDAASEPPADADSPADAEPVEDATTTGADDGEVGTTAAADVTVVLTEMFFEPERIVIPADTDVRVMLENTGVTLHNFAVSDSDISADVEPGVTAEQVINLPAGKYEVVCNVPGHKQAGMIAQLVVR